MKITPTKIPGVMVIDLERRSDERGFFARQWCAEEMTAAGLDPRLSQMNISRSVAAGTLRGIHFQKVPHAEVKLVRCAKGAFFDVAVDLRPESATYCQWFGIELSAETGQMLYIPEGCGHAALTLEPDTDIVYQASVPYAPASATGIRFNDPAIAIAWPHSIEVVSLQDRNWPAFNPAQREVAGS